jgi:hypothetical protein
MLRHKCIHLQRIHCGAMSFEDPGVLMKVGYNGLVAKVNQYLCSRWRLAAGDSEKSVSKISRQVGASSEAQNLLP